MLSKAERFKKIKAQLQELNEEALLADGFEDALIGICYRFGQPPLAMYDRAKCIAILRKEGMSYEDAEEFFEFNVIGAWVGDNTPVFVEVLV